MSLPDQGDASPDSLRLWREPRAARVGGIGLLLGALALLVLTRASEQTGDSLAYAHAVREGGGALFHPHHLIYNAAVRAIYLVLSPWCTACDAIVAGQLHNLFWALVAVVAFYQLLLRLVESRSLALTGAALLLVSQGFWQYATQVEVYIPTTAVVTLLILALARWQGAPLTSRRKGALVALLALAILYHQTSVLLCLPLALYLALQYGRTGLGTWVAVVALAGTIVLTGYLLAWASSAESLSVEAFRRFVFFQTYNPQPEWGVRANVSMAGVDKLLKSQLWALVAYPLPLQRVAVMALGLGILLLAGGWSWMAGRRGSGAALPALFVLWLLTYYAFFLWWHPGEREFFITPLVPLLALTLVTAARVARRVPSRVQPLIPPLLALWVLVWGALDLAALWPLHQTRGVAYDQAMSLAAVAPDHCLLAANYRIVTHLRYYTGAEKTLEVTLPLLHFYQRDSLPPWYDIAAEPCVVVPLDDVTPSHTVRTYNGYGDRLGWKAYLEWLLDVRSMSGGRLRARAFEVGSGPSGAYLILSDERRVYESLAHLLTELDRAGQWAGAPGEFQRWLAAALRDG